MHTYVHTACCAVWLTQEQPEQEGPDAVALAARAAATRARNTSPSLDRSGPTAAMGGAQGGPGRPSWAPAATELQAARAGEVPRPRLWGDAFVREGERMAPASLRGFNGSTGPAWRSQQAEAANTSKAPAASDGSDVAMRSFAEDYQSGHADEGGGW